MGGTRVIPEQGLAFFRSFLLQRMRILGVMVVLLVLVSSRDHAARLLPFSGLDSGFWS